MNDTTNVNLTDWFEGVWDQYMGILEAASQSDDPRRQDLMDQASAGLGRLAELNEQYNLGVQV
jgi:hypothetical protein